MSSPHKSPSSSNNGTVPSSQKKPSLPVRVIRWTAVQVISFVLAVLILGIGYAAVTWTNIPSGSGAAGQPVTQTLIQGIINNMNYLSGVLAGVDTRLDTLESGQTTGGTVTGPLRWSSEYSGQSYEQAWNTCLGLSPVGSWRIPSMDEIEIGRHINAELFTGNKFFRSSSSDYYSGDDGAYSVKDLYMIYNGNNGYWYTWYANQTTYTTKPIILRCVSNTN